MRFLVLALMIALVPLRGWAGEVMATEMASSQIKHQHEQLDNAIELIACNVHKQGISDTFKGEKTAFEVPNSRGDVCPIQASYTEALSHLETHAASLAIPPGLPHSPAVQFASAVTALGQKPPIS